MDTQAVDRIVNSVLYEGYLLYPYRQSLKNMKRWTFGSVCPPWSSEVQQHAERSNSRARCLVVGDSQVRLTADIRFLQVVERQAVHDGDAASASWHECIERRIRCESLKPQQLVAEPYCQLFEFPGSRSYAMPGDTKGTAAEDQEGVVRRQGTIRGLIEVTIEPTTEGVYTVSVSLSNDSPRESDVGEQAPEARESGHLQLLASAHVILQLQSGAFVSRIDPPDEYRELLDADPRDTLWPVLIGDAGQRDTMLCSPIILYDYPEIAPESPGDFFDATEIDEMLALRIMTLTDEEKRAVAALDQRGRALLNRTHELAERQLAKLHGTMRTVQTIEE